MLEPKTVLLDYSVTTDPDPLQNGIDGEVIVNVKSPGKDILCRQLTLTFDYGATPGNIFIDAPDEKGIKPKDAGWSLDGKSPVIENDSVIFTFTNNNLGDEVPRPFSVTFKGTINATKVAGLIEVQEESTQEVPGHRPEFTVKETTLKVPATVKPSFQIDAFVAYDKESVGHAVTEFANDQDFYLLWTTQGAESFQLFAGDNTTALYTGPLKAYHMAKGIQRATTFTLFATSKEGETLIRTLTITVSNPDLKPRTTDIDAKGLKGETFKVAGDQMTMSGSQFELDAPATLKQKVTIGGATTIPSLQVANAFDSEGINTLGLLTAKSITGDTVKGNALSGGSFAAEGPVAVMGKRQLLFDSNTDKPSGGGYLPFPIPTVPIQGTAPTDGFLVAILFNNAIPPGLSFEVSSYVTLTIGQDQFVLAKPYAATDNSGSMALPIEKGATFSLSGVNLWYNPGVVTALSEFKVYWQPLGNQSIQESDLVTLAPPEPMQPIVVEEIEVTVPTANEKLEQLVESILNLEDTLDARKALKKALSELL